MFQKTKPTFLSQAGRGGTPSSRKPMTKKVTKKTQVARASAMSKKTTHAAKKTTHAAKNRVVKNGSPLKSGKMSSTKNAHSLVKAPSLSAKASVDQRLSNYFMSHSPKLRSATNSPQTAPQSFRPKG